MDLRSYIELKESYKQMHTPQLNEEVEVVDEEILAEEDLQENPNAGAGHKNTDTKKDWANDPRWGVVGQIERARRKTFGTDREKAQANSYEKSVNDISKRQGTTPQQANISANDVAAETKGRRRADPNYQPGKNQKSNKNTAQVGPNSSQPKNDPPKTQPKNDPPKTQPKNDPPQTEPRTTPAAKITPKATPAKQTGDKKADMATWAKANPKLAAAKAKRDATRGTSASTNPLMKGLKSGAPKPAAPKADTTKSRPLTTKAAPKTGADATAALKSFASKTPKAAAPKAAAPKANPAAATGSSRLAKALSGVKPMKKLGEDVSEFDLIIGHLVEQGFAVDEALKLMVNMTEEKREQILEAAMHRDAKTGEVTDKAEVGKTYYPAQPKKKSSVALRKEKEAAEKQKTNKESFDSLASAYQQVFAPKEEISEEEADKLRDQRQERGGVDGNTRYDRAPKASAGGKKKKDSGMSAFDSVVAELKGKYGDKAIMAKKSEKKKD